MKKIIYSIFAIAAISMTSCGAAEGEENGAEEGHEGTTTETPAAISGTYHTAEGATVVWKAKHFADEDFTHVGTVPVSGNVVVDNSTIVGGEFTFDLTKMDEEGDGEWNQKFEGHLKSEDIFNVATYPTAKFTVKGSEAGKVMGTLEVMGLTQEVTIEGEFAFSDTEVVAAGTTVVDMLAFQLPYLVTSSQAPEEEKGQAGDPNVKFDINLTLTK